MYLGNHDQPRMISRFGNDAPEFRELSAKMLTTFLLSLRGTPYWFAGDEIGMVNPGYEHIEDYRDIATLNQYRGIKKRKGDVSAFLCQQRQTSRDNARSPMQWDHSPNAGFTSVTPWLKPAKNYVDINVAREEKDPDSVLNYFRRMVAFRKANPEFVYGTYTLIEATHPQVYAYLRESDDRKFLIALNFSPKPASIRPQMNLEGAEALMDNYNDHPAWDKTLLLRPYEALIVRYL